MPTAACPLTDKVIRDATAGRDLSDLAVVIEREPQSLRQAKPFLLWHRQVFPDQMRRPHPGLRAGFDAIATLDDTPNFDACAATAGRFLKAL